MSDIPNRDARLLSEALSRENNNSVKSGNGTGVVFWMLLFGALLIGVFTYLPGQLDPASYGHNGQMVNMVQPQGNNPDVDQQYSETNLTNSEANINNAKAYQRQAVVWVLFIFGGALIGIIMWFLKRIAG